MAKQTGQAPQGADGAAEDEEDVFEIVEVDDGGNVLNPPQQPAPAGEDADDDEDDSPDASETEDDAEEEPAEDARLGHTEGDQEEGPERSQRRSENRAKRYRKSRERQLQEQRIGELTTAIVDLQTRLAHTEGRSVQQNLQVLQGQLHQIESTLDESRATYKACMTAQDFDGAQEVIDAQFTLRENKRMLEAQIRQTQQRTARAPQQQSGQPPANQQPGQRQAPQIDPRVIKHAREFARDHKWYEPTGSDDRSAEVQRIDNELIESGMDPRTQAYWNELRDRVAERPASKAKRKAAAPSDPDEGAALGNNGSRQQLRGPRMAAPSQAGGSTRTVGKNQVMISPERKAAMKEAGAWDDVKKRDRVLRYYAQQDREASGRSTGR